MFAQMGTNLFCGGTNTGSNSGGYQNDGVFLSTDSGLNWALKRNGLPLDYVNVQALAVKGTDIFAGIWGRGVFLSMDTGNTWTAVNNGIADSNIYSIVINGNNIFAGAGDFAAGTGAIFLSSNNGTSWTDITPGLSSLRVWKLFAFGTDIFASTANGLYFSSDTGNTWSLRDNGLPGIDIINCFASNGSDIYVGTGFGSGAGVYFSADTGMNWVAVNNGLPVSPFVSSLCISNGNIFAGIPHFPGTNGVYLSTDNGNSWSDVNTGLTERSVSSLHVIGNDILAGTYSSVFRRSISEILSAVEIKEPYEHNSDCVIYPNPARDYFVVQFKAAIKNASVEIYNLMGEKLYMESLVNTIMSKINCKIISPGIYLVRVRDGEKQYCRKLFIEHD
jgi:hypothetical protein